MSADIKTEGPPNPDLLADGELRERACAAVEDFVAQHGFPVKRSQVEGLRQIATNEPARLREFAEHQRLRAVRKWERRAKGAEDEVAFWELIAVLHGPDAPPAEPWSLRGFALRTLPPDGHVPEHRPHPTAPAEERAAYQAAKRRREAWLAERQRLDVPEFFRRFCAHFLYRQAAPVGGHAGDGHPEEDDR